MNAAQEQGLVKSVNMLKTALCFDASAFWYLSINLFGIVFCDSVVLVNRKLKGILRKKELSV